jgi:hypothetical protein
MHTVKKHVVARYLSSILILATTNCPSYANAVTPPLTKCFIRVDNPHLSNSIKKLKGFDAVKVKATSTCDQQIRNLKITVEIYKKGFLRNYEVVKGSYEMAELIPANQKVENKGTWERCKNRKRTRYFGVAYAEAIINGKYMSTNRVWTDKIVLLACGT